MVQVTVERPKEEVMEGTGSQRLHASTHPIMRVRVMATYMVVLLRLLLPALAAACRALLRNQRCVRERLAPAVFAFIANSISLSSLSGKGNQEESLLPDPGDGDGGGGSGAAAAAARVATAANAAAATVAGGELSPPSPSPSPSPALERCVTCDVLHDPGPERHRADVIFIHGLHGSLDKTWRQGVWREEPSVLPVRLKRAPPPQGLLDQLFNSSPEELSSDEDDDDDGDGCFGTYAAAHAGDRQQRKEEEKEEEYSECWPRDWLPQDVPGLRVIALNYTTDPFLWRPVWVSKKHRTNMVQRGREMMEHLQRIGVGTRPIVWVGHSKGGLFVKQMIVDAFENGGDPLSGLYNNTKAIMFYSVPHLGSACADINLPLLRQSVELTEVQKDCPEVLELHRKFLSMIERKRLKAEVLSFIETIPTFMRILYIQIVSLESADASIGRMYGTALDHRNICKPTNRQCFLYTQLINLIQKHV